MIFFVNDQGTIINNVPTPVYQGSANANTVYLVAPFKNAQVTVAFRLPNDVWTPPNLMKPNMAFQNEMPEILDKKGNSYSVWTCELGGEVTEFYGTVTAQFFFHGARAGVIATTSSTTFQVGKGIPPILPEEPSQDIYDDILSVIASLQEQLDNGDFAARAIYAWNSAFIYGAKEITYYREKGEFGAFVRSVKMNNANNPPYIGDQINSEWWEEVVDFNVISEKYFKELQTLIKKADEDLNNVVDNAKEELHDITNAAEDRINGIVDEAKSDLNGIVDGAERDLNKLVDEAEGYKNEAQAAKDGAETARKGAETARDGAEAAQGEAEKNAIRAENAAANLEQLVGDAIVYVPELPSVNDAQPGKLYAVVKDEDSNFFDLYTLEHAADGTLKWRYLGSENVIANGIKLYNVELVSDGAWAGKMQSVVIPDYSSLFNLEVYPEDDSAEQYILCGVESVGVTADGTLTFKCASVPSVNLKLIVKVTIQFELPSAAEYYTKAETDEQIETAVSGERARIEEIEGKIPAQATPENQLADKAFVNSTVQTATANFRGNWETWAAVPTDASGYPDDYAGRKIPTVNDYLAVQDASGYPERSLEGTWRFKYAGSWSKNGKNGWQPEYQVNEKPLTAAQLAALDSGITASGVKQIGETKSALEQETARAKAAEQANTEALTAETARAKAAEQTNAQSITALEGRVTEAEKKNEQQDAAIEAVAGSVEEAQSAVEAAQGAAATAQKAAEAAKEAADAAQGIVNDVITNSQKGIAGGVASLDEDGKVPQEQLPDFYAAVTSVNGKTGEVTVTKFDLGLAEVAISGSYTDLKDKPEGVTSVNGQTGDVTVDKDTLGLAPVATSGKYTDLTDVPETGVVSVNGHSGQVELTAEDLQLGALAKLDQVGINDIKKDAVLETHIRKFAVSEEKLHDSAVVTRSIKDAAVTAPKLADETVKAGAGASVTRQEDGSFLVGLDASGVVTSVNGQTGAVTVDAETMGLADVAFSGKFSDLIDAPESGVLSVNGKTGAVTVDAASLGLAAVATSGKYTDLADVPEQAVLSVNGMTGEVVLDADNLQLGALAKLDQVGMNNIKKDAVLETHIRKFAVSEEKLHDNAVVTRSLKDAAVTASKLAEDVIKAQDGLSVSREEGGAYLVGLDTAGFVSSVNGQAGAVEITKETLGLKNVTSERQMPLAADTRMGADFDTLFPNGFYHILGTDEDPCTNNPVSMQNTSGIDCSWFLLVMATNDNSSAVQVAFSARKDFSIRMRCFSEGAWSDWENIS